MTVSVVGSGGIAGSNSTTAQFTAPAVVAPDDLFVMSTCVNPTTYDCPTPTGWTAGPVADPSGSMRTKTYWRWATGSEGATAMGWLSGQWATVSRKGIAWACLRGVDRTVWDAASDAARFASAVSSSASTTTCPTIAATGTAAVLSLWNERSSTASTAGTLAAPAGHTLAASITYASGGGICQGAAATLLTDDSDGTVGSGSWAHAASGGISVFTVRLPVATGSSNTAPTVTLSASTTTLATGEVATITATAADVDGTVVTVDWTTTAGAIDWGGNVARITNGPRLAAGTAVVTCTVTDDLGAEGTATVNITLAPSRRRLAGGVPLRPPRVKRSLTVTWPDVANRFQIWGHRGWYGDWPEESLAGYRATPLDVATPAHPEDAAVLEMDVGYLADTDPVTGRPYLVLNHDDDTLRAWVAGSTTSITAMTKAQWDAGVVAVPAATLVSPAPAAQPAAYLSDVLDALGGHIMIGAEPKTTTAGTHLIAEVVRRGLQASVIVQSSSDTVGDAAVAAGITAFKIYFSGFPTSGQLDALVTRGIAGIICLSSACNATTVTLVHSKMVNGRTMKVVPYQNVSTVARVSLMRSYGCDGVIPDSLISATGDAIQYRNPTDLYPWETNGPLVPSESLVPASTLTPKGD